MPTAKTKKFDTWDAMVADAHSQMEGIDTYELPLDDETTIEIPCPDGVNYIAIIAGQRVGDSATILNAMIPNNVDRAKVVAKMTGVPFPIVDVLTGKVLRHYYGLSIQTEEKSGNSPGS